MYYLFKLSKIIFEALHWGNGDYLIIRLPFILTLGYINRYINPGPSFLCWAKSIGSCVYIYIFLNCWIQFARVLFRTFASIQKWKWGWWLLFSLSGLLSCLCSLHKIVGRVFPSFLCCGTVYRLFERSLWLSWSLEPFLEGFSFLIISIV